MSTLKFPHYWITLEDNPVRLEAKGISAITADALVAEGGDHKGLWILFDGNHDAEVATVIGMGDKRVRAARLP